MDRNTESTYFHDSTRTILDAVMYETTEDLGTAQANESEDQDDCGNVRGHPEESHGQIVGTGQTTSQFVANDSCARVCAQTDGAHAREKQPRPDVDTSRFDKGGIEGHECHAGKGYEKDADEPSEHYEKMMQHIDEVLVYIDRSIERNTLSMTTTLMATTMIGFTILSGLMLFTSKTSIIVPR
jgi:hypothetical protein